MKFPKAILFDLDDTLITHSEALERALGVLYATHPELEAVYDMNRFTDTWKESLRWDYQHLPADKLSEKERRIGRIRRIWQPVRSDLSEPFCLKVAAEYLSVYESNWRLHEDVHPMLDDFRGVPLGVVTNGYITQQNQKLSELGVARHFSVVVTSEEAGVGKPAAPIFHLACQKLGVLPADAAFVGDLLETDALGAQNAGLHGIWLNRVRASDTRSSRVRTIDSLVELKAFFLDS